MFSSKNLGALIVAEEPHVKSWDDGQYNIMNMSIEETTGSGILYRGRAVTVVKNGDGRTNEGGMPVPMTGTDQGPRSFRPPCPLVRLLPPATRGPRSPPHGSCRRRG